MDNELNIFPTYDNGVLCSRWASIILYVSPEQVDQVCLHCRSYLHGGAPAGKDRFNDNAHKREFIDKIQNVS